MEVRKEDNRSLDYSSYVVICWLGFHRLCRAVVCLRTDVKLSWVHLQTPRSTVFTSKQASGALCSMIKVAQL